MGAPRRRYKVADAAESGGAGPRPVAPMIEFTPGPFGDLDGGEAEENQTSALDGHTADNRKDR